MHHRYHIYKSDAAKRGLAWELSAEDFIKITARTCHYCGIGPSSTEARDDFYGDFVYSGIDRLNNGVGYIAGNVVPCCSECNYAKHTREPDGFVGHCRRVVKYQESKECLFS